MTRRPFSENPPRTHTLHMLPYAMAFFIAISVACFLIFLTARGASGQPGEGAVDTDAEGAPYTAGELIVSYEEGASPAARIASSAEGTVAEELPSVDAQLLDFPEIKNVASQENRERLLEEKRREIESDPSVKAADYNYRRTSLAVPNDPRFDEQWNMRTVRAPAAWDTARGNAATNIAVIDSGIDLDHPDFAGKITAAVDCTTPTGADGEERTCEPGDAESMEDETGHGTHVAGIATAATDNNEGIAGTCPDCGLMVANTNIKAAPSTYDVAAVIEAISWAAREDADVINMSLGGSGDIAAERDAVNKAWEAGVTVVAAAGNENSNVRFFPAAYENVIAVSATTRQNARAGYSNFGGWVDVSAPGGSGAAASGSILSTVPVAMGEYGTKNGTSMASPVVAGVAGLLASQGRSNAETRERIEATAVDLGPRGKDNAFGHGRVDAAAAVGALPANTPPRIANPYPRPTSRLNTNVATIRAIIRDSETELQRKDIRLVVDGRRVNFTYNANNDRLTKRISLAPGRHRARIIATDEEGVRTITEWGFVTSAPPRRAAQGNAGSGGTDRATAAPPPRPGQSISQSITINQSR
ncbi:MAG: S8 family serine peptidase [Rubrobacteraceae bacterium]